MSRDNVADVLARVADTNKHIGVLVVELLNGDHPETASRLRELGQYLGALSAECLGTAAELDGRCPDPPERVIIDAVHDTAASEPPDRAGDTSPPPVHRVARPTHNPDHTVD